MRISAHNISTSEHCLKNKLNEFNKIKYDSKIFNWCVFCFVSSHLFVGPGRPPLRLSCDFAPTNPKLLEICALDVMTTINIDGVPREIRFYGLTAVVFLSNDDPREIRFQEGYRNVLFNDEDSIRLKLNDEAVDFELDGKIHK